MFGIGRKRVLTDERGFIGASPPNRPDDEETGTAVGHQVAPESAPGQETVGRTGWVSLGQMLVDDGVVTAEQLAEALRRQREHRGRLGQILIEMKLLDEEVLLKYLGRQSRKEANTQPEREGIDPGVG